MKFMNKTLPVVILAALTLASLSGCDETPRLQFKNGQKFTRKITHKSELRMLFPNADNKYSELVLDCMVLNVNAEGVVTVEAAISSINAKVQTLGLKFAYDSEDETVGSKPQKGKAAQQQKFTNAFKGLKGKKYCVKIDKNGTITEIFNVDPRIKQVYQGAATGDLLGSDQVNMLLNINNLKEYICPVAYGDLKIDADNKTMIGPATVMVPYIPLLKLQRSYSTDPKANAKEDAGKKEDKSQKQEPEDNFPFGTVVLPYRVTYDAKSQDKSPTAPKTKSSFEVVDSMGKGTVAFLPNKGKLVQVNDRVVVEVKSGAAGSRPADSKRKAAKMFYIVTKIIE